MSAFSVREDIWERLRNDRGKPLERDPENKKGERNLPPFSFILKHSRSVAGAGTGFLGRVF
jgi:hypothetical protein